MKKLRKIWTMKSKLKYLAKVALFVVFVLVLLLSVLLVGSRIYAHRHTEYAPGYSYRKFRQVQVGTSEQEVSRLLGQPLRVLPYKNCIGVSVEAECSVESGHYFLLYSQQDEANTDYLMRHLEIKYGVVAGITSGFYAD
ncbi:MAG: hypothetical protein JNK33_01435 [Candidatus Doudnabacteria bacterium]|nr:hypothetical protein [Candidatus Doudnabacteria bacterium]